MCGNYIGYVGCKSPRLNANIKNAKAIPGFPVINNNVETEKQFALVQQALNAAIGLQLTLYENRQLFADNGDPANYQCGVNMRRCDTVTIKVVCDKTMKDMMETGWFRDGDTQYIVMGLPTPESKTICNTNITDDCRV